MARKILRNTRQLWVDTMGIYMLIGWLYIVTILWFRIIFAYAKKKKNKNAEAFVQQCDLFRYHEAKTSYQWWAYNNTSLHTLLQEKKSYDDRRRKYQKTIDHATDIQIQKICKNIQQWFQKKQRYGKIQKIFYYALTILSIGIFWWILHD